MAAIALTGQWTWTRLLGVLADSFRQPNHCKHVLLEHWKERPNYRTLNYQKMDQSGCKLLGKAPCLKHRIFAVAIFSGCQRLLHTAKSRNGLSPNQSPRPRLIPLSNTPPKSA